MGKSPGIIIQKSIRKENGQNVRLTDHQEPGTQTAETSWNGTPDVHINLTPAAGPDLLVHHRIPVVARLPDSQTFIFSKPYYSILYDFFVQRGFPQKLKGGEPPFVDILIFKKGEILTSCKCKISPFGG